MARIFRGRTKRGNPKTTTYKPVRGKKVKVVRIKKRNGRTMAITTITDTYGRKSSSSRRRSSGRRRTSSSYSPYRKRRSNYRRKRRY